MSAASASQRLAMAAGSVLFCLLAILNCGGYRYGVGDQAFYIPAVVQHLDPALFQRDRMLLHVQDRFMAFDDLSAWMVKSSGISLPVIWFGLYVLSLVLLFAAAIVIGRILYQSWWTVALLTVFLTLRHRITQTGANSLEAYFQPRLLAFAAGVWAIAAYLRGRPILAFLLAGAACLMHPTTGLWFGIWLAVAVAVSEKSWRVLLAGCAIAGTIAAWWMVAYGPLRGHLTTMDPRWASVLAGKDYVFPFDLTAAFWLVNVGYAAVIVAVYVLRKGRGLAAARESGLVAGALALVLVFLAVWGMMRAWVALALQLQPSRVFWILDFLATCYLSWLLAEGLPLSTGRPAFRRTLQLALVAVVTMAAAARGLYVTLVEHRGSPLVAIHLPRDNWTDVMAWIARTPRSTHVLADPGHAWKYGSSVRVSGERDVYLEEVKDTALALYSRDVAMRVLGRVQDIEGFDALAPARALALAKQYDLNYLVIEHDMNLPLVYQNPQFRVYALSDPASK